VWVAQHLEVVSDGERFDVDGVVGMLALDRWQGTERAQLRILDIAEARP